MGLFSSKNTTYRVTGTAQGWFGPRKVTKAVTGRRAAEREATRMQRRGVSNVRRSRGPWWMS
jgi:hypothetical protein